MAITEDFDTRVEAHRRELVAHCYRMLGGVDEAEDVVQETMLRAWRARERYDQTKASLRTWLYAIATNACLSALQGRARRPLPSDLVTASDDPGSPLVASLDVPWLQPFPDDPATVSARRGSLRLALIAAMQNLPARQRAVLVLRDVLDFSAAEVASMLDTSAAAVNSSLQRARARLSELTPSEAEIGEPDDEAVRGMIDRYMRSFEAADVNGLVALLTEDAILEMPPVALWYLGRVHYGQFIDRVFAMRGTDWRMVPASANTQPALVAYCRGEDDVYRLHSLQVFTITAEGISRAVVFADPRAFATFGLPPILEPGN